MNDNQALKWRIGVNFFLSLLSVLIETLLTMDGKKSFAVVVRVASKEWIETVVSGQTKASLIIGNH